MAQGGFITITVSGHDVVRRKLVTWGTTIADLTPAWEQIGDDLRMDFLTQFIEEGGYYGKGSQWAPLRPATIADRARQGYGPGPKLWRGGYLIYSVISQNRPGNITEIHSDWAAFGTAVEYAGYLHYGTSRMVARQVVGVSWKRKSGIVRVMNEYIQEQARNSGVDIFDDSWGSE